MMHSMRAHFIVPNPYPPNLEMKHLDPWKNVTDPHPWVNARRPCHISERIIYILLIR